MTSRILESGALSKDCSRHVELTQRPTGVQLTLVRENSAMKRIDHCTRIRINTITFASACMLLASGPLRAQGSDCVGTLAASSKMLDLPYHMYMIDSAQTDSRLNGGKPTVGEVISTGGMMYVLHRGKWTKSPLSTADMKQMQDKQHTANKAQCSHLRDESVNGEPAAVWRTHSVNEAGTIETDMWISKTRNVLLKTDIHQDVGGVFGKSHIVSRYDYTNVQTPAGGQ
ncbi:MAG TPA: hypothetical protein VGJ12_06220 [Gemmatimonadaceae bacterium]